MSDFAVSRHIAGHVLTTEQRDALNHAAHQNGDACAYCGYEATDNTVVFRDGNPLNTASSNLAVACPVCLARHELDTVGADAGVMVWLPALKPADVSHLQRAIAHALLSPNKQDRKEAESVLGWLASHDTPVQESWGSTHPQAFGSALQQLSDEQQKQVNGHWKHLSLILHPGRAVLTPATSGIEALPHWWPALYLDYCSRS